MKVLNVDELAKVEKEVVIKNTTYAVEEMSVEGYLEFKAMAKKIEEKKQAGAGLGDEDFLEMMRTTVRIGIPSLPADVAAGLKLVQLSALCDFINGTISAGEQQGADTVVASGEGDAKKS